MNIVGFIPARGGSKGITKKNIRFIGGKPLIVHTIDACKNSKLLTSFYVSTDDKEISKVVSDNDCLIIDRPEELASDTSIIEEAMEHFTKYISYDIIVLLQPTSPMVQSEHIDGAIDFFIKEKLDSLFSAVSCEDILIWNEKFPLNYSYTNRGRRQDRGNSLYLETGAIYITTKKQFKNSKCRLGGKIGHFVVPYWTSMEVDSLEDLSMIDKLMRR
jgi:CMP-N,N'-diacetyllegionaminic acid synthase